MGAGVLTCLWGPLLSVLLPPLPLNCHCCIDEDGCNYRLNQPWSPSRTGMVCRLGTRGSHSSYLLLGGGGVAAKPHPEACSSALFSLFYCKKLWEEKVNPQVSGVHWLFASEGFHCSVWPSLALCFLTFVEHSTVGKACITAPFGLIAPWRARQRRNGGLREAGSLARGHTALSSGLVPPSGFLVRATSQSFGLLQQNAIGWVACRQEKCSPHCSRKLLIKASQGRKEGERAFWGLLYKGTNPT